MTAWRQALTAHLEQLKPLLRRRTPVRFDNSTKALQLKSDIRAWNRRTKELLQQVPQSSKRTVEFGKLGKMSFTTLEDVRIQLKQRERFLRTLLPSEPKVRKSQAGVVNRNRSRKFKYDFCLTFAGTDREFAADVNAALRKKRQKTFFDMNKDARTRLLGEAGPDILHEVFSEEAELCLLFASAAYRERMWTSLERKSAQQRDLEQGGGYIIPIRLDETRIPGLPHTIGYLSKTQGSAKIADEVIAKLKAVREQRNGSAISRRSRTSEVKENGPSRPKRGTVASARKPTLRGHAVLIGDRVYAVQHIKRAGSITVTLRVRNQAELTALRRLQTNHISWALIPFADVSSGDDVSVTSFEEHTDHTGLTTVLLELRPSQQHSPKHYGVPALDAEGIVRQVMTGVPHTSGWISLPQELKGGVVALARQRAGKGENVALHAHLLASYHLHKLQVLSSIKEMMVTRVGRHFRVRLQGTLNTGAFAGEGRVELTIDERVAG